MRIFNKIKYYIVITIFLFSTSPISAQIRDWNNLDGTGNTKQSNSCLVDGVPTLKCFEVVIGNFLFMANAFIILVLFIMFVIGSFKYLTSLGSPDKVEEAKGTFKWAVIGLIVYVSSYLILIIIDFLFLGGEGKIFQFEIGSYGLD